MTFRSLVPRLPAQTFRYSHKTMLAISTIWLCLFCENASILNKMSIFGQAPSLSQNSELDPAAVDKYGHNSVLKAAITVPRGGGIVAVCRNLLPQFHLVPAQNQSQYHRVTCD